MYPIVELEVDNKRHRKNLHETEETGMGRSCCENVLWANARKSS